MLCMRQVSDTLKNDKATSRALVSPQFLLKGAVVAAGRHGCFRRVPE